MDFFDKILCMYNILLLKVGGKNNIFKEKKLLINQMKGQHFHVLSVLMYSKYYTLLQSVYHRIVNESHCLLNTLFEILKAIRVIRIKLIKVLLYCPFYCDGNRFNAYSI